MAAFLVSWGTLHWGFYAHDPLKDTPLYERYGDLIARGQIPYRDFSVEYPPGALPVFVLPSLAAGEHDFPTYARVFEALMGTFGVTCSVLAAATLTKLRASPGRITLAVALVGLGPLALGPVLLSRFDLWPAALTAAALAALVFDRSRLGFGLLGLAVAAKVYPIVLVIPALFHVKRERGRREALVGVGILVGVLAAVCAPFAALAPRGLWASLSQQASRPLQIESLGSSVLLAAHHLWGLPIALLSSHGSDNLAGGLPRTLALEQSVLQLIAIALVWIAFARSRRGPEELLRLSAAAVCAFIALGKVLSPQYLGWLLPLVPLVRGRRGLAAGSLLVVAMLLTQTWFPYRYLRLVYSFDPIASWLVLARNLTLLGLLAVLAWPEHPDASTQTASETHCPRDFPGAAPRPNFD